MRMTSKRITGDLVRFFCRVRPAIRRKMNIAGRAVYNCWVKVDSVSEGKEQELVDLQTSAKTFVAGGFVSHNCPTALACWSPAGVERTIDTKPHLWLTRAGFEASGITVFPVDGGEEE